MERFIEVKHFEFKKVSPLAYEGVDERIVPLEWIVDIYINRRNLICEVTACGKEINPYEDLIGSAVPYFLELLKYKYRRVRTVELYNCSGCYQCYPVSTDVYFYKHFVVWRYLLYPYRVRKVNFIFPLEVYLQGYKTLLGLAKEMNIDLKKVFRIREEKKEEVRKFIKKLYWFKGMELGIIGYHGDLSEFLMEFHNTFNKFRNLVDKTLTYLDFFSGMEDRTRNAIGFLGIYDPERIDRLLAFIKHKENKKERPRQVVETVETELIPIMEKAIDRCVQLLEEEYKL
jgi:hypothetical protein